MYCLKTYICLSWSCFKGTPSICTILYVLQMFYFASVLVRDPYHRLGANCYLQHLHEMHDLHYVKIVVWNKDLFLLILLCETIRVCISKTYQIINGSLHIRQWNIWFGWMLVRDHMIGPQTLWRGKIILFVHNILDSGTRHFPKSVDCLFFFI